MISSVPYVPPDTMKNVAATSGQSVSFAILFFAVEIAWVGMGAGSDNELNFYSRPPQRTSLSRRGEASSQLQDTRFVPACKRKMRPLDIFSSPGTAFQYSPCLAAPCTLPGLALPLPVRLAGHAKLGRLL